VRITPDITAPEIYRVPCKFPSIPSMMFYHYADSEHQIECPACIAGVPVTKKNLYTVIKTKRIRPTYKELISKHRRR
jgi:hypothetical protein